VPRQERRECVAFAQPVEPGFHEGPGQQAGGRKDEDNDDGLVFERVALEASGEDVLLPRVLADGQIVVQAERARAVGAGQFVVWPRGSRLVRVLGYGILFPRRFGQRDERIRLWIR